MIAKISKSDALETINQEIVTIALEEGAITENNVAVDATHLEARDQSPRKKNEKPDKQPKKRGRKSKAEREQWLKEQREKEETLPLYEKKIEYQLDVPYATLQEEMPLTPHWGVKKNSENKNVA